MTKITKFTTNRAEDRAFRAEVLEALKGLAEKHGIEFSLGNGKIAMDGSFIKIELKAGVVSNGVVQSEEARDFLMYAEHRGMKKEWLGQVFKDSRGNEHKITGFRYRASSKPVVTSSKDGNFVWDTKSVIFFMSK